MLLLKLPVKVASYDNALITTNLTTSDKIVSVSSTETQHKLGTPDRRGSMLRWRVHLWIHPELDFLQTVASVLLTTYVSSAVVGLHLYCSLHHHKYPFEMLL